MNEKDRVRLTRIYTAMGKIGKPVATTQSATIESYVKYGVRASKAIDQLCELLIAMRDEHQDDFESWTGEENADPFLDKLEAICSKP